MKKVITFGVFDYFHLGHLRLFKQARQFGDYLIVAVQDDDSILSFKPDTSVFYSTEQRVELIEALRIVDEVRVYSNIESAVKEIEFDILALGEDHVGGRFSRAEEWCIENGKQVVHLRRTPGISSTEIKRYLMT